MQFEFDATRKRSRAPRQAGIEAAAGSRRCRPRSGSVMRAEADQVVGDAQPQQDTGTTAPARRSTASPASGAGCAARARHSTRPISARRSEARPGAEQSQRVHHRSMLGASMSRVAEHRDHEPDRPSPRQQHRQRGDADQRDAHARRGRSSAIRARRSGGAPAPTPATRARSAAAPPGRRRAVGSDQPANATAAARSNTMKGENGSMLKRTTLPSSTFGGEAVAAGDVAPDERRDLTPLLRRAVGARQQSGR